MNVYGKMRRFAAKQLRWLSAAIEPTSIPDDLSKLGAYRSGIIQDTSTIQLIESGHTVTLRKTSSDILVFEQLFIQEEYKELVDVIRLNKIPIKKIVDLGANIGLATLYLRNNFPNAACICVEPDELNFELLKTNVSRIGNTVLYRRAVWATQTTIYLNRNFRDGKDWSIAASDKESGAYAAVPTITIGEIIRENHLEEIDLLKIDIEGAESELFKDGEQVDFLDKTKVLAIEIHDEFDVRDSIVSQLIKHNFFLVESKQTLLAVNASYVRSEDTITYRAANQSVR